MICYDDKVMIIYDDARMISIGGVSRGILVSICYDGNDNITSKCSDDML